MSENENKICIYAICKNESQFIERWLTSCCNADYIVVLDTGSTDDTYDKLKQYAAINKKLIVDQKVVNPWRFDTARNLSLDMAYKTDANIFFCIDLDEVLVPGWDEVLKAEWVEGVHERAVYKYTWSHSANGAEGRSFWSDKIHSRNWTWIYPVHEFLSRDNSGKSRYSEEEALNLFDRLHLEHFPDSTKSRSSYLPLLELRLEENPDDLMTQMYLGHEYYYRGHYKSSIEMLNKVLDKLPDTGIEAASCYLFIGDCYKKLDDKSNAIASYYKSLETDYKYIEPYIALGHIFLDDKMYGLAISIVKEGLKKSVRRYSWLERDNSWSFEPWDVLTLATFYGGYKKESLAYAMKAYTFDKEDERLLNNINQILACTSNSELL